MRRATRGIEEGTVSEGLTLEERAERLAKAVRDGADEEDVLDHLRAVYAVVRAEERERLAVMAETRFPGSP